MTNDDDFVDLPLRDGEARLSAGLLIAGFLAIAIVPSLFFGYQRLFDDDNRPGWAVVVATLSEAGAVGALVEIFKLFQPSPRVSLTRREFSVRPRFWTRRTLIPFAEVDRAIILYEDGSKDAPIQFRFGRARGRKGTVTLRPGSEHPVEGSPRALLAAALRECPIALPPRVDDGDVERVRNRQPRYLDKASAIATVLDPPKQSTRRG